MPATPMRMEKRGLSLAARAYFFEPKIAGLRLLLFKTGSETRVFSEQGQDCTRLFPELHLAPLEGSAILDGEACCIDPQTGAPALRLVTDRLRIRRRARAASFALHRPVVYLVWDILQYNGKDLRAKPLIKRKSILESVLKENRFFRMMPYFDGSEALIAALQDTRAAQMIAKPKESLYTGKLPRDWLEIDVSSRPYFISD